MKYECTKACSLPARRLSCRFERPVQLRHETMTPSPIRPLNEQEGHMMRMLVNMIICMGIAAIPVFVGWQRFR